MRVLYDSVFFIHWLLTDCRSRVGAHRDSKTNNALLLNPHILLKSSEIFSFFFSPKHNSVSFKTFSPREKRTKCHSL